MSVKPFIAAWIALFSLGATLPPHAAGADDRSMHLYFANYERPKAVPYPKDNPYSKDKYELGKMLFFDTRISASQIVSCGTCHNPALSWGDGLPKGVGDGMKPLGRRTPTLLNVAWSTSYFWDGRAETLEDQALGPIQSAAEMNVPLEALVERIKGIRGYHAYFKKVFPKSGISAQTIAKAIATYERTIVSAKSDFDAWNEGDEEALSDSAKRGFLVFTTKGQCSQCHNTWRFTDDSFQDIGLPDADPGRGHVVQQVESLQHAFKTPTLRNVALRAPYMHDGSLATLAEVVEHYNKGGAAKRPSLATSIKPLNLSAREKTDLVNFMQSLTSKDPATSFPRLPR
jgi:cytochrome c peroxidase